MVTEKKLKLGSRICQGIGRGVGHLVSATTVAVVSGVATGGYQIAKGAVQGASSTAKGLHKNLEERVNRDPQLLEKKIKHTQAMLVSCSLGLARLKDEYLPLAQQILAGNHEPAFLDQVADKRRHLKKEEKKQQLLQAHLDVLLGQQQALVEWLTEGIPVKEETPAPERGPDAAQLLP